MMANSQNPAPSFLQRNFKKRWIRICSALVLLFGLSLLVLPLAVRIKLERWLLNNGADQATISKIRINLFTGSASISGLDVTLGGKTVLANSDISLNLGLGALFSREAFIQRATLHDFILDIEQSKDGGWRIGSISIPPDDSTAETQELEKIAANPWFFGAQQLEMVNCTIHYVQPDIALTLQVEHGLLTQFSTNPADISGTFLFKGKLNNAPLELNIDTLRIAPEIKIKGRINTADLQLDNLAELLRKYINPFSGQTGAKGEISFTLAEDSSILVDYTGSIDLDEGNIGGPEYGVSGKKLSWNGPVSYLQDADNKISVNLDGSLKGSGLSLDLPAFKLRLTEESFDITSKTTVIIDQQVTVNSEGTINLSSTDFALPPYQVHNKKLTWEGNALYTSAGQHVQVDGILNLREPSFSMAEEKNETTAGGNSLSLNTLTLTNDITLPLADPLALEGSASLQAKGLLLTDTTQGNTLVSLDQLSIEDMNASGEKALQIAGMKAEKLEFHSPTNNALAMTVSELIVNRFNTEDMQKFSVQNISVQGLFASNTEKEKQIASIDSLTLTNIRADTSLAVDAQSLLVNNARIFEQTVDEETIDFLKFARLTVTRPGWKDEAGLNIADIKIEDLDIRLIKDKTNGLLLMQGLRDLRPEPSGEETTAGGKRKEKKTPSDFTLQIGKISTTGKSDIRFEDHSLKFPFIIDFALESFQITDLDSGHPDRPASYELSGKLGKYAPLTANGSLKPFGEDFSLQQTLRIQNYPMVQLAPYALQYIGIIPTQGTLSVETTLSIEKNYIDLQKNWLIRKLEIKTMEEELAKEFNSQLPLPLDAALSMLEDKHHNIELAIPISGPAGDLDFGITDLFITPLSKAIVSASSSYLLYVLGPYGAAAYVGLKVGEKLMETRVPPVEFEPGKIELTGEQKEYLERIAEILNNRPKLDMQLCARVLPTEHLPNSTLNKQGGHSSEYDKDKEKEKTIKPPVEFSTEDKKALLKLGKSRTLIIKDYLVGEHDINPGRLIICLPEIDETKDAKPRVELEI